ncbi:MAG: hypothetical protein EOP05_05140 [Proteobacteria bacterium]|nr:MAG: hypothetical protein EOP05_05140 [Pseudomonadota bacterium]
MHSTASNSKRSRDVLSALKNHGPLSAPVLAKIISPTMRLVAIKKSLAILREKGFVRRWSLNGASSGLAFFEIRQEPRSRVVVAQVLGCQPDQLIKPFYRRQDLIHHQWVEYWIYLIQGLYPDAEIVRESQLSRHETAGEILLLGLSDYEVHPDFLVIFPPTAGKEITSVAIEIERTRD